MCLRESTPGKHRSRVRVNACAGVYTCTVCWCLEQPATALCPHARTNGNQPRDSSACIASGSGARTGSRTGPAVTRTKGTGARVEQGYRRTYRRRGAWAQGWLLTGLATAARKNAASRCNLCILTPFCCAPCHTYVVHTSHDLCIFSLQMTCCVLKGRRPEGVMVDDQ